MIIEKLEFSHLNDAQPGLGTLVFICDGAGTYREAELCVVDEDEDEWTPDDNLACYWYCEDNDERYALSDYPFWANQPSFEFPEEARNRKMNVFINTVDKGEKEVINDTYEIVGSEIRKK